MENDLDGLLDISEERRFTGARPTFLTVLCILTFVGAGLGILIGVGQVFLFATMQPLLESDIHDSVRNTYNWVQIFFLATILGNIACLIGAILMWRLKRAGFYLYFFGQFIPVLGTILSFAQFFANSFFTFGIIGIVIGLAFPVGFSVLYGLNYKYLNA